MTVYRASEQIIMKVFKSHSEGKYAEFLFSELFRWKYYEQGRYKNIIEKIILNMQQEDKYVDDLVSHVLNDPRLGDPRFKKNEHNWIGISEGAKDKFNGMLSRLDIKFFFEHVIPLGTDRRHRKEFWLSFANQYISRPLLCSDDRSRLRKILDKHKSKIGHFGCVKGTNSVFLLDLENLLLSNLVELERVIFTKNKIIES